MGRTSKVRLRCNSTQIIKSVLMSVADAFNQLREEAKTSSTLDAMFRCDAQFRFFGQHS